MRMIELQDKFAQGVVDSVRESWDEIRIHYENAVVDGMNHEIYTAAYFLQGVRVGDLDLDLELLDTLVELKGSKPEGQDQEWTWLEFVVNREAGKYRFDYKYDTPPIALEHAKHDPDKT